MPHPSEIYTEQLSTIGEGTALWYPEPHETGEVQIGDVGYIFEGAFIKLFNTVSETQDSRFYGQFETPLRLEKHEVESRERVLNRGPLNSRSVVCKRAEVKASGYVISTTCSTQLNDLYIKLDRDRTQRQDKLEV